MNVNNQKIKIMVEFILLFLERVSYLEPGNLFGCTFFMRRVMMPNEDSLDVNFCRQTTQHTCRSTAPSN